MRRVSVPFKLSAVMVLAACTLLVALGLVCSSAYGNVQSDDETAGSTPLMAASVDDFTLMAASSKSAVYNVGAGSCTCDDPDTDYTIVGTSKNGATVTIKGGDSEARAVHVTLDNVIIDQGPVKPSSAPITVESGYAVVKLRGTNVLRAGYKEESFAHDWGFAGLSVPSGATCIITSADGDGSTNGSLEAHGGHNKYGGAGIGTDYNLSRNCAAQAGVESRLSNNLRDAATRRSVKAASTFPRLSRVRKSRVVRSKMAQIATCVSQAAQVAVPSSTRVLAHEDPGLHPHGGQHGSSRQRPLLGQGRELCLGRLYQRHIFGARVAPPCNPVKEGAVLAGWPGKWGNSRPFRCT